MMKLSDVAKVITLPERNVILHLHGPQSGNDAATEYKEIAERAIEMNVEAIALSDHGTMTGLPPFKTAMAEKGIKFIPSLEAYVQEDKRNEETNTLEMTSAKSHLILIALDNIGYKAMSKALTKANKRIDSKGAPRMNKEILNEFFGPGSIGHEHVVATTACMQGYVNSIILEPFAAQTKIDKLAEKQAKYLSPDDVDVMEMQDKLSKIDTEIAELRKQKNAAATLSKKSFAKKEQTLKANEGTEKYAALKEALDKEKEASVKALDTKKELESKIAVLQKEQKALKAELKSTNDSLDKWYSYEDKKDELSKKMVGEDEIKTNAKASLQELIDIFGENYIFVEVQYHGIDQEAYCMPIIANVAREMNIPLVAANDVHIVTASAKNRRKRQLLRSLRYNKFEPEYTGDDQLYMKTNEELAQYLLEILPADQVQEALDNTVVVSDMCNYVDPGESHYPKYISSHAGETADGAIRRIARENIEWRYPDKEGWTEEHEKRLEYELGIICSMGYSDYHLIVQDFLDIGRKMGHMPQDRFNYMSEHINEMSLQELVDYINEDQSEVGLFIGPGRGSAVGSLVCYLLGITSIDPLKYDLLFERFLNPERISMPDIDSDFASECRGLVLEYVKKKYGADAVCCIMTKGTQAAKNSIRNCARILGSEMYDDTKAFLSLGDQIAKEVPNTPKIKFNSKMKFFYKGETFGSVDDINKKYGLNLEANKLPEDVTYETLADQLKAKFADNENALMILQDAFLVEGTFTHYGMHAAGVIISDNGDVSDHIPLMWDDKNNVWKSQCDMVEAEESGLLKMDFLGLNNLTIISECLRLIRKRTGKKIDIERVPIEEDVLRTIYQAGATNSIFQFESGGMKQMLRQFGPDSIHDLILLNAAYRPGPMQYLDKIVKVKHGKEELTYLTKELEPILCNTYGSIIYQEQVMRICQDLAGYSLGGADMVRRYMSKKKADKLEHEKETFIHGDASRGIKGCVANGVSEENANELFGQMMDFASYAFNKSHACAYAIISYYTAYLKYHYPAEYLCATMNNTPLDKIPGLIEDCKMFNINVLPPNINDSDYGFTLNGNDIVFGLGAVKNVGASAHAIIEERNKNGKFASLKDYLKRGHVKKDSTESLIKAGGLDTFCANRFSMMKVLPEFLSYLKKLKDKNALLETKKADLDALNKEFEAFKASYKGSKDDKEYIDAEKAYTKKYKSLEKSINNATEAINTTNELFNTLVVPVLNEDKKTRLAEEKELLGVYVSSHPLDEYPDPEKLGAVAIEDLVDSKDTVSVFGIIKDVRKTVRKSDGKPMAFFKLEDRTGEIDIKCFTKAYEDCGLLIEEDKVVKLTGKCFEEESFFEEGETLLSFNLSKINEVKPERETVILHVNNIVEWTDNVYPALADYIVEDGYPLVVHFRDGNTIQKASFQVSFDLIHNKVGLKASVI